MDFQNSFLKIILWAFLVPDPRDRVGIRKLFNFRNIAGSLRQSIYLKVISLCSKLLLATAISHIERIIVSDCPCPSSSDIICQSTMKRHNGRTNDKVLFIIYFIIDEYSQMYN